MELRPSQVLPPTRAIVNEAGADAEALSLVRSPDFQT